MSDHALDPLPRLLEEQRGARVGWHEVESGPPRWLVRVERVAA